MIRKEQLYEQILEQIDLTKETDDEELQELIRTVVDEAAGEEYISLSDKIRIGRELFNSFRKLDVLQELLEDDSITEIMVNGIDHIFYEKEGRIFRSKKCFLSQERLLDVIQHLLEIHPSALHPQSERPHLHNGSIHLQSVESHPVISPETKNTS